MGIPKVFVLYLLYECDPLMVPQKLHIFFCNSSQEIIVNISQQA